MRFKAAVVVIIGVALFFSAPVLKQAAGDLLARLPVAHAAGCGATKEAPLGGTDCAPSRDDTGGMGITAKDTNGNPIAPGGSIYRGESITLTLSYTVTKTSSNVWDAWMDLDTTNDTCYDPTAWSPCLSNPTSASTSQDLNDHFNVGDDAAHIEQNDNCPSFYYNIDSPYYYGLSAKGSNPAQFKDFIQQGTEYQWSDPNPGDPGHSTCLGQGESAVWHGAHMSTLGQKNYSVTFHVNPNYAHQNGSLCISGDISKGDVNGNTSSGASVNGGDLYYRTSANSLCLVVNNPITVSGNVQSDPVAATGQRFANQSNLVSVSANCTYSDMSSSDGSQYLSTDANGSFYLNWNQGEPFCMQPNTQGSNPASVFTWGYNGTTYNNVRPPNYYPLNPNIGANDPASWTGWNAAQVCNNNCGGYNMYWTPAPVAPVAAKSIDSGIFSGAAANYGPGANLSPGSTDTFYVTGTNPYDSNTPSSSLTDDIPLNIDPSTIVIDSVKLVQSGGPSGWSVQPTTFSAPLYTGGVTYNMSGYTGCNVGGINLNGTVTDCGRLSYAYTAGAGTTRPNITFNFTKMPAYSQLQVQWHGKVWSTQSNIGVYPGFSGNNDTRYCANETNVNYSSINSIQANCQDFNPISPSDPGGYEGVSNFATAGAAGVTVGNASNVTYSPIPGVSCDTTGSCSVPCLSKGNYTATDQFGGNDASLVGGTLSLTSTGCNTTVKIPNPAANPLVSYIYAAPIANGTTGYDNGTYYLQANIAVKNPSGGPVFYNVDDQTNGGYLDSAMTANNMYCPADNPATACNGLASPNGSQHLQWANLENLGSASRGDKLQLDVAWDHPTVHAVGQTACNTAQVSLVEYWLAGPRTLTGNSNTVCVKRVDVTQPGIKVTNNDVDAGTVTQSNNCKTPYTAATLPTGYGTINTNTSQGQYVVSASGNITSTYNSLPIRGFNSNGGLNTLTQQGYGLTCLPNITQQVGTQAGAFAPTVSSGAINDSTYDGKIMAGTTSGGTFTLGTNPNGTTNITKRWTLYVNGNVYINSNIAFGPTGSLAIVATGNIMIDPSVTRVDAFLYADTINTCENASGSTLGAGFTYPTCNTALTINGLAFARHFRFNRTSTVATTPSEVINFSPQLYLYTPPGLSDINLTQIVPSYTTTSPRY